MGKAIDITGQKFNHLTAIEPTSERNCNGAVIWHFHCDCGNTEVYLPAAEVKRGRYKRCKNCSNGNAFGGEEKRHSNKGQFSKLYKVGDKVGRLTILEVYADNVTAKQIKYKCICECGNEKVVRHVLLRYGGVQSCGCLHIECSIQKCKDTIKITDITGKQYCELTAIKCLEEEMKATAKWEFQCSCGNTTIIKAHDFLRGRVKSCGCINSNGEYFIIQYLKNNHINYKSQVSFPDLVGINGGLLRYDFGIYDNNNNLKALIEFDGYYHFHRTNLEYGGVNVHDSTVEHDKRKTKYCIDNKIPLYRLCNEDTVHNELEEILKEI